MYQKSFGAETVHFVTSNDTFVFYYCLVWMFKTATYSNIETNAKTYGNNNIAPVTLATKNLQESLDDAPGGVARKLLAVGSGRPPPSRRREAWLPGRVL